MRTNWKDGRVGGMVQREEEELVEGTVVVVMLEVVVEKVKYKGMQRRFSQLLVSWRWWWRWNTKEN